MKKHSKMNADHEDDCFCGICRVAKRREEKETKIQEKKDQGKKTFDDRAVEARESKLTRKHGPKYIIDFKSSPPKVTVNEKWPK